MSSNKEISIDELKRRVPLLQVVQQTVEVSRDGSDRLEAKCPFHADGTPSLKIWPNENRWKCFGCERSGDVFAWIQNRDGVDFKGALAVVRDLAGIRPMRKSARKTAEEAAPVSKEYFYRDEAGNPLYKVCRKDFSYEQGGETHVTKTFFQLRYDPRDKSWARAMGDVRRVLYRLPELLAAPPDAPIWLVEGEKDCETLRALGLVATTWAGGAKQVWLPAWTELLRGRQVMLCPDTDEPGQAAGERLCRELAGSSEVRWVRVPAPHKDVSDWMAAGGTKEQLLDLAAAAGVEPERPPGPEVPKLWGRAAKHGKRECNEIAEEILTQVSIVSDKFGYTYQYNGRFWEQVTGRVLQKLAKDADKIEHTNRRRRGEIADYLEMATQRPQIHWRQVRPAEVPLQNGVFDVDSGELRPHRKEDYLETVVPVEYDPGATCPTWEAALGSYFGEDEDRAAKVAALQQFFGYALLPHARYKKALILFGEGDTGKSQVVKLLQELIGRQNCCGVSVEAMDDERKRVPLVGKLLNVLTEISAKAVIADGGFKTLISTEEELLFDPKYLPQFMYAPIAKHVVATNNLPQINDLTKATYNRLLVVKFNRVIPRSEQDPNFLGKLKGELPGVLNWALAGAADLTESSGEWVDIPESRRIIDDYRSRENEINSFLEEECVVDVDEYIKAPTLREKFRRWAGKNYSQRAIGNMMVHAGYPGVPSSTLGCRVHKGLRWREPLMD